MRVAWPPSAAASCFTASNEPCRLAVAGPWLPAGSPAATPSRVGHRCCCCAAGCGGGSGATCRCGCACLRRRLAAGCAATGVAGGGCGALPRLPLLVGPSCPSCRLRLLLRCPGWDAGAFRLPCAPAAGRPAAGGCGCGCGSCSCASASPSCRCCCLSCLQRRWQRLHSHSPAASGWRHQCVPLPPGLSAPHCRHRRCALDSAARCRRSCSRLSLGSRPLRR